MVAVVLESDTNEVRWDDLPALGLLVLEVMDWVISLGNKWHDVASAHVDSPLGFRIVLYVTF